MRRRELITLLGGAAVWPLAARAQQGERMRRIGVLMNLTAEDSEGQARLAALLQGLQKLGWTDGRKTSVPRAVRPCPRGSPAPPAPRRARSGHCR
jgi:putative ABC transport system substrate-binding protein